MNLRQIHSSPVHDKDLIFIVACLFQYAPNAICYVLGCPSRNNYRDQRLAAGCGQNMQSYYRPLMSIVAGLEVYVRHTKMSGSGSHEKALCVALCMSER